MNFAKNLLGKYGWKEGDGLGRNNDGMAEPLKQNYKFDKTGLGHNKADEMNNHWWENVYNSAAENLDINRNGDDGTISVGLKSGESVDITTKTFSIKCSKKSKSKYAGQFLKTATLVNSGAEIDMANKDTVEIIHRPAATNILSDEELLRACNGRTAHKGARHGLKLSGKLARIEAQEKEMLENLRLVREQPSTSQGNMESEAIQKWIEVKSRKHRVKEVYSGGGGGGVDEPSDAAVSSLLYQSEYASKISKKKRKRTKEIDDELADALATISTAGGEPSQDALSRKVDDVAIEKKKSKSERKRLKLMAMTADDEMPVMEMVAPKTEKKAKKRNVELLAIDASMIQDEEQLPKKIKKSKKNKFNKVAVDLTHFQAEHFLKSKIPMDDESKAVSKKSMRKSMNKINSLAKELQL